MKVKASKLRKMIEKIQAQQNRRGTFFSVEAIKRTDGTKRKYVSHFGYKKYLNNGEAPYDFEEKNLLPVWDWNAWNKYDKTGKGTPIRTINCDQIYNLKCCGMSLVSHGRATSLYKQLDDD